MKGIHYVVIFTFTVGFWLGAYSAIQTQEARAQDEILHNQDLQATLISNWEFARDIHLGKYDRPEDPPRTKADMEWAMSYEAGIAWMEGFGQDEILYIPNIKERWEAGEYK